MRETELWTGHVQKGTAPPPWPHWPPRARRDASAVPATWPLQSVKYSRCVRLRRPLTGLRAPAVIGVASHGRCAGFLD
jgi:hypothetical protein